MKKHVSYDKMSKKNQRLLNSQKRVMWSMNPVTRRPDNPKAYNRRKALRDYDYHGSAFAFLCEIPAYDTLLLS